jgi:hypothetical protein
MVETIKQNELEQPMYQSVISRHDSSLLTLSSEDATAVDTTYGNGKFTCQLKNANRGGTHAIKVVPNLVMVPNVFNNVNDEPFQGGPTDGGLFTYGSFDWALPIGYYTQTQFVNAFNTRTQNIGHFPGRIIKMSVTVDGFMQFFTLNGSFFEVYEAYTVQMSKHMADMLGFTVSTSQVTLFQTVVQVVVPADGVVIANVLPCMGTTPLVYVVTRQLAMNRMTASDSKEYNVIATVSMHDVPYGSYGVFRGGDIFMEDVEFRTPRALDQIDVELLDYKYRPLKVDTRYPVSIQLKVFHTDTVK